MILFSTLFCVMLCGSSVTSMERVAVVTEAELKNYSKNKTHSNELGSSYNVSCVYEMIFAKDVDSLIEATARVAHLVPLVITSSSFGNLIAFNAATDLCAYLLKRLKKKTEYDIQALPTPEHEIRLKFYRAYCKYLEVGTPSEFAFQQKIALTDVAIVALDKKSSFL